MFTLNQKLELAYPDISKWAVRTYGIQNGLDYVHSACIFILESYNNKATLELSDNAFLGFWRIQINKAQLIERYALLSNRWSLVSLDGEETLSAENVLTHNNVSEARALVRHMLPHLPFVGRKVMYRLYVLGESVRECSKALGLSTTKVERVKQDTTVFLGKLIKQSNLEE